MRAALVLVVALAACERGGTAKPPAEGSRTGPPRAADLAVDGIRLGDRYGSTVMSRDPYRRPCDDDGIEQKRRRAMVYGGRPCRDHAFPEETTVIFLLDWADHDDFDQPIRTIAWMGGHYFDRRADLPFDIGDPVDRVRAAWGAPVESFTLGVLGYARYGDDLHVIEQRDLVVGVVVGEMPADRTAESWEVVDQMYRRYTPRLPGGDEQVSRDDCKRVLLHALALSGDDPAAHEARLEREIDECVAEATPEAVQCALAATTLDELDRCR